MKSSDAIQHLPNLNDAIASDPTSLRSCRYNFKYSEKKIQAGQTKIRMSLFPIDGFLLLLFRMSVEWIGSLAAQPWMPIQAES